MKFGMLQRASDFIESSPLHLSGDVPITDSSATAVLRVISVESSLASRGGICGALPERCIVADGDVSFGFRLDVRSRCVCY